MSNYNLKKTFKKYGGLSYSENHNIVRSNYTSSNNLFITNSTGLQNSRQITQSHLDMSNNSILNLGCLYFGDGTTQCTSGYTPLIGTTGNTGYTGATGFKGMDNTFTGYTGPIGYIGYNGYQGNTGEQGPIGNTGVVGPEGPKGDIGYNGEPGSIGNTGVVGPEGPKGDVGYAGDVGNTGSQGLLQGSQGEQGYKGQEGDRGDIGSQGTQGTQGPQGPQGPQGHGFWSSTVPTGIYYYQDVGINTNKPLTNFDVNGDINVRGKIEGVNSAAVNVNAYDSNGNQLSYYTYNPLTQVEGNTGYIYYLFTGNGSFTINGVDSGSFTVNYIVIGSGGKGGDSEHGYSNYEFFDKSGGGGGASIPISGNTNFETNSNFVVSVGTQGNLSSIIGGTINLTSSGGYNAVNTTSGGNITYTGGIAYSVDPDVINAGGGAGASSNGVNGSSDLNTNAPGGNPLTIDCGDGTFYTTGYGGNGGNASGENPSPVYSPTTYGSGGPGANVKYNPLDITQYIAMYGAYGASGVVLLYFPNTQQQSLSSSIVEVSGNLIVYGNQPQTDLLVRNTLIPTTTNYNHYIATSLNDEFKYQLIAVSNGKLYLSSNYGKIFTDITPIDSTIYTWSCVAMSGNGQYMLAGVYYYSDGSNNVYQSRDYGKTWNWVPNIKTSGSYSIGSVTISNDGVYQSIALGDVANWGYWTSSNSGLSFSALTINSDNNNRPKQGASSYNGKYMAIPYNDGAFELYVLSNYFINFGNTSNASKGVGVAISADGKYATECVGNTGTTYTFVTNNNYLNNSYYNYNIYINGVIQSATNYYNVTSVSMDMSGQFQVACAETGEIFISADYGINWDTLLVDSTQKWSSIVLSQKIDLSNSIITFLVGSNTGLFTYNVDTTSFALNVFGASLFQNNILIDGNMYANNYFNTSDYRIKEVLSELDDERDKIDLLRPVKYQNLLNKKIEFGFIAHELQEIFPNLVFGEKDADELQRVNYVGLISLLVKEIQNIKKESIDRREKFIEFLNLYDK